MGIIEDAKKTLERIRSYPVRITTQMVEAAS